MNAKSNVRKVRDVDTNPCIEEGDASLKCLDASNYNKNMCFAYFSKYKNCRKYWGASFSQQSVMLQRRREGIKPDMPSAKEREEILGALGGKPY